MNKKENSKISILTIANVPGPNLNDFYDNVAEESTIDLEVLYCSKSTLKWKDNIKASKNHIHSFPVNFNLFSRYAFMQINPGVWLRIFTSKADLILIQGFSTPTLILSLMLCNFFSKPFIYWGEAIDRSNSKNLLVKLLKRLIVKLLVRAEGLFIVGSKGMESYARFGLPKSLMMQMDYSCNLAPFVEIAEERNKVYRKQKSLVTTSQLIFRKRVDLLLRAFIELAPTYPYWNLNIIGDGALRQDLVKGVPEALRHRIIWHGYLAKLNHPEIYKNCDIFVLPSREDGGPMAMTEAMASGLPVLTTDGVFTAYDLVGHNKGGVIVPKDDYESLRVSMKDMMDDDLLRAKMGIESAARGRQADSKQVAELFAKRVCRMINE